MSTVHLLALFLVLGSASLWSADADLRFYSYEIVIEDRGHEETLSACPVYDNKEVAFTARWDDSHRNHYRMRKLMEKYGLKGTFFLNHKRGQSFDHEKIKGWDGAFGAHSMTHARLASELSINRMFWEVAEIRAILEAEGDQPINSYCFSDGNFRNLNRRFMQGLIADSLQRVGYIHNMDKRFVDSLPAGLDPVTCVNTFSVNDRSPSMEKVTNRINTLEADPSWKETDPCIGFGVHAWMSNDKHWEALEAIYNKYAGREDWWYCSQTEYAAYRKMLQLHQLSAPVRDGNSVRYVLRLPYAADIGADISFTLRYSDPTAQVSVDGQAV